MSTTGPVPPKMIPASVELTGDDLAQAERAPLAQTTEPVKSVHELNLTWLLQLRWSAIVGQIVTIAVVREGLGFDPPLTLLAAIIALEAATNIGAHVLVNKGMATAGRLAPTLMVTDLLCLTGLLYLTGGPHNPFNFLYLVYIALSSVVLQARWTWILAGVSATLYGLLFFDHVPLGFRDGMDRGHMWMHLEGMWVAFMVAAAFITTFVHRVTSTLARREAQLREAREQAARSHRLMSLATLAAGAAHELATPLSTIAVLSKELELALDHVDDELVEDARLIREQTARCRVILDQMATDAGHDTGEARRIVTLDEVIQGALRTLPRREDLHLEVPEALGKRTLEAFPTALTRALRGILKNALEASPPGTPVTLHAEGSPTGLTLRVCDQGEGAPPDILARMGEPFFTTKVPGKGMGLGLYLTRTVLERMGGALHIESTQGQGTEVTMRLPG